MNIVQIKQRSTRFPRGLKEVLDNGAPDYLSVMGNPELLSRKAVAVLCSIKAPGNIILQSHDVAQLLRQVPVAVISGFHSPVEREMLRVLLQGQTPVILCPARSIEKMRVREEYRAALDEGRLAIVSPFSDGHHRATKELAWYRNRFVAALASSVLVTFAYPGSKTEQLCREVIEWRKPLYALENPANAQLIALGAQPLVFEDLPQLLGPENDWR